MAQTIGYQSLVTFNAGAVMRLTSVQPPTREVERIDVTHCESPNWSREALPGLLGTVVQRLTCNYDGELNNGLETAFVARTIAALRIEFAGTTTEGLLAGDAYISALGTGFTGVDGLITRDIEFTFTERPTWTAGA